ncbi:MAG: dTMP kinase [Desulfurivibrio sp.]|nr:dTMP kinase [Desulfurivibrio sp.]
MENSSSRGVSRPTGILIAFEGIDGTGKSTQLKLLAGRLREAGLAVVTTCEPTDGPHGRYLRQMFQRRAELSPAEELRLFIADRRDHVARLIAPALAAGQVVLTDRYYFSTAAYQGAAGHDPAAIIAANEQFAPRPDLVLLLEVPPAVGIGRVRELRGETLNDFEQEDYLRRVTAIFAALGEPCIRRIDATGDIDQVQQRLWPPVRQLLRQQGLGHEDD